MRQLPPVLLLHGWGGSYRATWQRTGWQHALEAQGRRVIGFDLPGHGPADGSAVPEDYADLSGLVAERIPDEDALDVVGYSLGAKIALQLVLRYRGRIRRLVLAGLGDNLFARENGGAVADALRDGVGPQTLPAVRNLAVHALQSENDLAAMTACLLRPAVPVTPDEIRGLSLPVLLAVGDQDEFIGSVDILRTCLPHARFHRLPGIDHLATPLSSELETAALGFLSTSEATTGHYEPVPSGTRQHHPTH
ncbi:alpha/beta fold hydrolase [Rhodococcus opacus]|uniref:alpha/beta fold hydrolase n=1 Tax=Rhodococcus opacus TaxID=37919 RepID=UPI002158529E|nr:alpha/beta hydrolase [Rhodococcus opacus]